MNQYCRDMANGGEGIGGELKGMLMCRVHYNFDFVRVLDLSSAPGKRWREWGQPDWAGHIHASLRTHCQKTAPECSVRRPMPPSLRRGSELLGGTSERAMLLLPISGAGETM